MFVLLGHIFHRSGKVVGSAKNKLDLVCRSQIAQMQSAVSHVHSVSTLGSQTQATMKKIHGWEIAMMRRQTADQSWKTYSDELRGVKEHPRKPTDSSFCLNSLW